MSAEYQEQKQKHPNLILYRGWDDNGEYVWSPFVTKIEFHLRLNRVAYTTAAGSIREGPRGKIPYLEIDLRGKNEDEDVDEEGEEGKGGRGQYRIGDSGLIIKHLIELNVFRDLNAGLDAVARLQDLGIRAFLEEKLYFYNMHERWIQNYHVQRNKILSSLSSLLRPIIGLLIYRRTVQTLHGQGTGRFTAVEISAFRKEIWVAINEALLSSWRNKFASATAAQTDGGVAGVVDDDGKPFWILGGEQPTEADATVFGFVSSVLVCESCPESRELVRGLRGVMEYASRIHDVYFPDHVKWT